MRIRFIFSGCLSILGHVRGVDAAAVRAVTDGHIGAAVRQTLRDIAALAGSTTRYAAVAAPALGRLGP